MKHKATLKQMLAPELRVVRDLRPDLAVVKLADGVDDNWTFLAGQLKDGVEVVDFWHAAEHINTALGAAYGDGSKEGASDSSSCVTCCPRTTTARRG